MKTFTTMIMAGGRGERLFPLTRSHAKPAIRFGGIYYIIDFTLSNCVRSGVKRIFMLTQFASSSLERHIRRGWAGLFRSEFGEYIETRPPQNYTGQEWYTGTADCIFKNIDLIEEEHSDGVLILSGDHIYKMDYRKLLWFHHDNNADLTVTCIEVPLENVNNFGVVTVDKNSKIKSFDEKPDNPKPIPGNETHAYCNMGVYYFQKDFLVDILKKDSADKNSSHDFGKDIIPKLITSGKKIFAYEFLDENKKGNPYWRDIGTLDAYYEANMDLIDIDPVFNLYDNRWPIRCFNPQLPPAKTVFNWQGENRVGLATDSLISPGVIISGGRVERSILSPEVHVRSYTTISNSILFDRVEVGQDCCIKNAIIDRNVKLPPGTKIGLNLEEDRQKYTVTEKGVCVVTS